jgi:hypothetical protein
MKLMEDKNTYTLGKMKKFLSTLSKEQLKQPVHISFDDCPIQDLWGHQIVKKDIYVALDDSENVGTISDHKQNEDESEPFAIDDYKICTPKGTVLFF